MAGNQSSFGRANYVKEGVFSSESLSKIASQYLTGLDREELLTLLNDPVKRGQLPVIDDLILTRIGESLRADSEGRQNFDSILDRTLGKPKQTADIRLDMTLEQLVMQSYNSLQSAENEQNTIEHMVNEDLV